MYLLDFVHAYIILIALRKWNSNIKIKIIGILYNNVFNGEDLFKTWLMYIFEEKKIKSRVRLI